MKINVILAAAGSSERMGSSTSKVLLPLLGKPALLYSMELFAADPRVTRIIVAVPRPALSAISSLLASYPQAEISVGGSERSASVRLALAATEADADAIAVHDGARPLLHAADWQALTAALPRARAAILAAPCVDTVKRVKEGFVTETLERSALFAVQTPQIFAAGLLRAAYADPAACATDDAALVERQGVAVAVVQACYENPKLTFPADLAQAEAILRQRAKA